MTRVYLARLSSLLALLMIYFLLWKYFIKSLKISTIAFICAIALSLSEIGNYALTGRNDFLAIFFEVLAACFFVRGIHQPGTRWIILTSLSCTLAFFTRQNLFGVIGGSLLFLAYQKNFKKILILGFSYVFFISITFFTVSHFEPHFLDHSFKAHTVIWRAFYWGELSTLSFFICYSLFILLFLSQISQKTSVAEIFFLKILVLSSSIIPLIHLYRPGSWLNYFFEPIFYAIPICALKLDSLTLLSPTSKKRQAFAASFIIVCGLSSVIALWKAKVQYRTTAFFEYERGAQQVRELAPQGGITLGGLAQGIGVYLRDWEIFGPEILNGAHFGETNYPHFKWVYETLDQHLKQNRSPALLYAHPKCAQNVSAETIITDPYLLPLMGSYRLKKVIYPWLCLYSQTEILKQRSSN